MDLGCWLQGFTVIIALNATSAVLGVVVAAMAWATRYAAEVVGSNLKTLAFAAVQAGSAFKTAIGLEASANQLELAAAAASRAVVEEASAFIQSFLARFAQYFAKNLVARLAAVP